MKLGEVARLIDVVPSKCWKKQRWKSEGAANAHLRSLLRSPKVVEAHQLNAYLCPICQWYHVGHTK